MAYMKLFHKLFFLSFILWAGCGGCNKKEEFEKAEPLFQKGLSLEREGQYSSAAEQYRLAIAAFPEYRDACFQLGNLYEKLGIPEKAREQYKKVIELDPDYAPVYNNLGNVSGQLGNLDAAIDAYSQAIRLDEKAASAHHNLGQSYILKHDFSKAEMELKRACELAPDETNYALALGMLYTIQQKSSEAVIYLQRSVNSDTLNGQALYQLSVVQTNMKLYDEALRSMEKYRTLTTDPQEQTIIRIKMMEIKQLRSREKLANSLIRR